MRHLTLRTVFVLAGWISLLLGLIGIFLPILPTTPFVILAAYFFSKGSTRLHQWLISRPHLGRMVLEWERHGIIRMRAKIVSTVVIIPLFAYTLGWVNVPLAIKAIVAAIGVAVLTFIWSRPSQPGRASRADGAKPRTGEALQPGETPQPGEAEG